VALALREAIRDVTDLPGVIGSEGPPFASNWSLRASRPSPSALAMNGCPTLRTEDPIDELVRFTAVVIDAVLRLAGKGEGRGCQTPSTDDPCPPESFPGPLSGTSGGPPRRALEACHHPSIRRGFSRRCRRQPRNRQLCRDSEGER